MSTSARTSALRAVPASPLAGTRHRPLPIPSVRLVGGPLAAWQQRNGEATIPHCIEQLEASGVLDAPLDVDDLAVLPVPITVGERDTLVLSCRVINAADGLYGPDTATELGDERTATAIPFSTWGNRAHDPMRVWLPRAPRRGLP